MPNTKSAVRRVRRVKIQSTVNRLRKSKYRSAIKKIENLINSNKKADAKKFFPKLEKEWKETSRINCYADEKHAHDYSFLTFNKK